MVYSANPFDHTGTLDTTGYGLKSVTSDIPKDISHAVQGLAITGATFSGTTVTATTSSTANLFIGQPITVAGITGFTTNNPNGVSTITAIPSPTTLKYVVAAAPTGTYTSGGTISANAGLYAGTDQANTSAASISPAFDDVTLAADAANRVLLGQPVSPYLGWK